MSITVTGLDELFRRFDNVSALRVLDPPMQRGVLRLEAYMKHYPSAPPMSTYRRTGSYGRRWTTRIDRSTNSLTGRVGNNINYGPYVGSRMFQVPWHARTGWRTDADAVRDNETAIVADFQHAIEAAIAAS